MSEGDVPFDFFDSVSTPQSSEDKSHNDNNVAKIRFDPFADNCTSTGTVTPHSGGHTESTSKKVPPRLEVNPDSDADSDAEHNFAIFSPSHAKTKTKSLKFNILESDELEPTSQGMVLGRVSGRSLLMRDWIPYYYVIMVNRDIRYYEDQHFLKHNSPDDFSIIIYRERYHLIERCASM